MGAYLCKDAEHAKQAKNEKSDNAMLPASEKVKNLEKEDVEVENPDIPFVDATVDEEENNELLKNDSPGKVVNDYNKCSAEKQIIEECHKLESQSPTNDNITSTDDTQKVSDKQQICGDETIEKPHVEDVEINKEISESFNIKEEATIEHNEVVEKVEEKVENSIVNKAIEEHNLISEVEVPEKNVEVISEPEYLSEHLNGKQVVTVEKEDKNEIAECEIDIKIDIKTDIADDRNVSVEQHESDNKDIIIPEPEILIETNLVCETQPVDYKELDNQLERHVNVCFQGILDKDSEIIDSDNQKDDNIDKNNLFDNEQQKQIESEKDEECSTEKNDIQTFIDVEKVHEHRENDICQEKEILNQTESLSKEFVSNEDQDLDQKPIGDTELESQLDENIDCEMVEEALVEKHIDSQMKENVDEDHKQVTDLVSDETKLDENQEHNIVSEHKESILAEVQVNNENLNVEDVHEKEEFSGKHMTEEKEQICEKASVEHLNENVTEESHEDKEQTVNENNIKEDQDVLCEEAEIDMLLCPDEEKDHQPTENEGQVTESGKLNEIDVNTGAENKENVEEVQEKNYTEETNSEFVKEQVVEEDNFNEHVEEEKQYLNEEGKQMSVETEEYTEDKHQDSTEDELIISAESSEHQDGEGISQENTKCIDEDKQHDIKEDEQISRESKDKELEENNEQDIGESVEHQDPTEEEVKISVENNEQNQDENNDEIENFPAEFQDMIEIDKNHIEVTSALESDNQVTKENLNENLIMDIDLNNQNISTNGNLKSDANESDDQSISNDLEIDIGVEDVKEEELIKMVSDAVDEIMGDAETQVQHIIENSASKDHSLELLES